MNAPIAPEATAKTTEEELAQEKRKDQIYAGWERDLRALLCDDAGKLGTEEARLLNDHMVVLKAAYEEEIRAGGNIAKNGNNRPKPATTQFLEACKEIIRDRTAKRGTAKREDEQLLDKRVQGFIKALDQVNLGNYSFDGPDFTDDDRKKWAYTQQTVNSLKAALAQGDGFRNNEALKSIIRRNIKANLPDFKDFQLEDGVIDPTNPMFVYYVGQIAVDAKGQLPEPQIVQGWVDFTKKVADAFPKMPFAPLLNGIAAGHQLLETALGLGGTSVQKVVDDATPDLKRLKGDADRFLGYMREQTAKALKSAGVPAGMLEAKNVSAPHDLQKPPPQEIFPLKKPDGPVALIGPAGGRS